MPYLKGKGSKIFITFTVIILAVLAGIYFINNYIIKVSRIGIYSNIHSLPEADAVLVLGASVYRSGKLSDVLYDRTVTAIGLYQSEKVKKILVSGHHLEGGYDEVAAVNSFLSEKGIPREDILLDYQGDDTFSSMARIKPEFNLERVIITTQNFHLPRAIYIGKSLGLKVSGFSADRSNYEKIKYFEVREIFARVKAFFEVAMEKRR